jgi:hypothetical protein
VGEEKDPLGHAAEEVARAGRLAVECTVLFAVTALLRASHVVVLHWEIARIVGVQVSGAAPSPAKLEWLCAMTLLAESALVILTAAVFLAWLSRVITATAALGAKGLRWTASAAVWAFFIPVLSLWQPYKILRDVHDALDPGDLPEPKMRVVPAQEGYRRVSIVDPPPPGKIHHASIRVWWGAFLSGLVLSAIGHLVEDPVNRHTFSTLAELFEVISAFLAWLMVRAVTDRLGERLRRVRFGRLPT